jgi:hypothetical protein
VQDEAIYCCCCCCCCCGFCVGYEAVLSVGVFEDAADSCCNAWLLHEGALDFLQLDAVATQLDLRGRREGGGEHADDDMGTSAAVDLVVAFW